MTLSEELYFPPTGKMEPFGRASKASSAATALDASRRRTTMAPTPQKNCPICVTQDEEQPLDYKTDRKGYVWWSLPGQKKWYICNLHPKSRLRS
jgi:hypothetical protein